MTHLRAPLVLLAVCLVAAGIALSLRQVFAQQEGDAGAAAGTTYLPLIGSGGAGSEPTPSPTHAASATPTATPSSTATQTATTTPTATTTQTETVTPTATPTDEVQPLPDPGDVAPPLDPGGSTDLLGAVEFIFTGEQPIQTGVVSGAIAISRTAVLRGKVLTRAGTTLPGVQITVLGHPEFGQTLSRSDGMFDLAVNGGGQVTLSYAKKGFLPAQRAVDAPWRDYAWLPDVVLIPFDPSVTAIDLSTASIQVARGSVVSDTDGLRQATILFPQGTTATLVLSDGTTSPVTALHVRVTEYTVGPAGPQSMPAELPPSSGYTYAAEFSVDEAVAAGATAVRFSQPLPLYVDNFLGFPVGGAVPAGYYDRQVGRWVASANGRVIQVLDITGGLADLDLDGTGLAANAAALTALGITDDERARLAQLYTAGHSFWRVPIAHFTPWDFNWPYGPPDDAEPPPDDDGKDPKPDDPNRECGSVIGCEDQTLGESIPVAGTTWRLHYQSERTPGRLEAYTLRFPVTRATIPASLRAVRIEVSIAGQLFRQAFIPAPNLVFTVTWDGKDAYGRVLQGAQEAKIRIDYDYAPQYYAVFGNFANSFARAEAMGAPVASTRGASVVTLSKQWTAIVGAWDGRAQGLGGWSLSIQHAYDFVAQTLLLGDGRQRRAAAQPKTINTVAGIQQAGYDGDGGPATAASLRATGKIAVAPDGALYIADAGNRRVRRVGTDGVITTVAGNGSENYSGDGGPATTAGLLPMGVAVGPDGGLYIADFYNNRVRRVDANGIITTVVGGRTFGDLGDGGPAANGILREPMDVAFGPDGSLYIAERFGARVRRVGPDGIITTIAGYGGSGSSGDGGPAVKAALSEPRAVDVGADGSVYILVADRVRKVSPDGIIRTVAGNGSYGYGGDGGPATAASLYAPDDVAVGPNGILYIADRFNYRVRLVGLDGVITTVAGRGYHGSFNYLKGDGGPATAADLREPAGVAVGPDGTLYIAADDRVRRVRGDLPDFAVSDILLPAEDGSELYVFSSSGRHLRTLDALTGATRYQFNYAAGGYLTSIVDSYGNVTAVARAGGEHANGAPLAIVAPGGQRTVLGLDSAGWLAQVTNPVSATHSMSYTASGLLLQRVDPRAGVHRFGYDALGRLVKDENPAGGSVTLSRTEARNGYTVTTTSALGRIRTYQVEELATGTIRRIATQPGGTRTTLLTELDGSRQITRTDGAFVTVQLRADPRWGMLAPVVAEVTIKTPGGRTRTIATERTVALATPGDLLSLATMTEQVTENGATSTYVYDRAARRYVIATAAGRTTTYGLDARGQVTQALVAALAPISLIYDSRGLLDLRVQGLGAVSRTTEFTYDDGHNLSGVTDALGRTTGNTHDPAGRPITQTLPDGQVIGFAYDASDNLVGIAPPGRPQHRFDYSPIDLPARYAPPDVNPGSDDTQFTYNADRQLLQNLRPAGPPVGFTYDGAGRLQKVTTAQGAVTYAYSPTTGQIATVGAPGGVNLAYSFDGGLLTGRIWSGPVAGSVGYDYDNRFRLSVTEVNGANAIAYQYASDSVLTQAGALVLGRNGQNGLLTGSALGSVTDAWSYNEFAEPTSYSSVYNGAPLYGVQLVRDALGRVVQKTETISGATEVYSYTYDLVGRLTGVTKNGTPVEAYTYDANGNRLTGAVAGGLSAGIYDAQDRLVQYGATLYAYSAAGELMTRTAGVQVTTYSYDALGNLLGVTLPNGTAIAYLVDGENHRVGKRVNGSLVQRFLYESDLRPIAELDGAGNLVSRFVYATHANVPDYMVKGGATYRLLTDHLGSPRLVVDTATGAIVQRMDYNSFGNVLADTNPGFQPFGFAGGLYDPDTKLVRFVARDYDGQIGRWTAKDPILFAGGQANLYVYAHADPVNHTDIIGLGDGASGGMSGPGGVCTAGRDPFADELNPDDGIPKLIRDGDWIYDPTTGEWMSTTLIPGWAAQEIFDFFWEKAAGRLAGGLAGLAGKLIDLEDDSGGRSPGARENRCRADKNQCE